MKNNVSFNSELSKFGIGLFETIRVDKKPIDLDLHINRMISSINDLDFSNKYGKEYLEEIITNYIEENSIVNKALRLTIFDEGYNISSREIVYNEDTYNKGFKLTISPLKRGNSILYKHKTTNYYENIFTNKFAKKNNFDDGIFVDMEDTILECSMSNIFFIKDSKVYTPSQELPILSGIMRQRVIDICKELEIEVIEDKIKLRDISDFDFIFISNSLMKVMKVIQIDKVYFSKSNDIFEKISNYLKNIELSNG